MFLVTSTSADSLLHQPTTWWIDRNMLHGLIAWQWLLLPYGKPWLRGGVALWQGSMCPSLCSEGSSRSFRFPERNGALQIKQTRMVGSPMPHVQRYKEVFVWFPIYHLISLSWGICREHCRHMFKEFPSWLWRHRSKQQLQCRVITLAAEISKGSIWGIKKGHLSSLAGV